MRIVIADDEKYVRLVLKDTLQHLNIPVEIVGEANDGREAYEMCCACKPDLLITDICMPEQDGFVLLEKIRETFPELPIIIYSGYDNFSYAQRAIRYKIEEYLLKPIDEEKLETAIRNIEKHKQSGLFIRRNVVRNEILQNVVNCRRNDRRLYQMTGVSDADQQEFLMSARGCSMGLFYLQSLDEMKRKRWEDFFAEHPMHSWCLDEEQGLLSVICEQKDQETIRQEADAVWKSGTYLHNFVILSDGTLEEGQSFEKIRKCLIEMDGIIQSGFWNDVEIDTSKEPEILTERNGEQYNQKYISMFLVAIRLGKKNYLKKVLKEYWEGMLLLFYRSDPIQIKSTVKNFLGKEILLLNLSFEACEQVAAYIKRVSRVLTAEQVFKIMEVCSDLIFELYKKENEGNSDDNMKEIILDYLAENYNQDITLEKLAEYLHFNFNYTSSLFKKIFGKSFVAYLTEVRMEEARRLLDSRELKVYEVARQVGYEDERYFQKTFKKIFGVTPKDYQKRKNNPNEDHTENNEKTGK